MAAPHVVSFAVEHGWWDPDAVDPFNVWEV